MFHKFTRVGTVAAVTAALVGGSLLAGAPAQAATHKIDPNFKSISETIKVGTHKDKITVKATTAKAVAGYKSGKTTVYVAKSYQLTLKNGSHVLYSKTLPTFKALGSSAELFTHKSFANDKKIVAQLKKDVKRSEAKSKTYYQDLTTKLNAEFSLLFGGALYLGQVDAYAKANPQATTFPTDIPTSYNKDGIYYTLTGTPQAYVFKIGTHKPALSFTYTSATKKVTTSKGWVHYYTSTVKF